MLHRITKRSLIRSIRCPGRCRCPCACTPTTPVPKSKRPSLCSPTTPPGSTAKECCGTRAARPTFSPSTRYRDLALALGPSLFHWESQSTTTETSSTGQGYIHHGSRGSRVLLFVREQRKQGTVSSDGASYRGWGPQCPCCGRSQPRSPAMASGRLRLWGLIRSRIWSRTAGS